MRRRYRFGHLILASVIVLGLTPLMVVVDAQTQIVFMSHRDGNPEIYVVNPDGRNQRRLTNNSDDDWFPSWSPDGKRIAFVSKRNWNSDIYVVDADGGDEQRLTENPNRDSSPSWSPDGKRIVFSSDREGRFNVEIYVIDADGGNLQRLTNTPDEDKSPSWSPDGKRIVFSARREGHFENKFAITEEIYVMDADGRNEQRLTDNLFVDWAPVWSPDSKRIAFSSDRGGNFEIYVMNTNGKNLQNLTNNPNHDVSPAWLNSPFSVVPVGKKFTMWGRLKGVDR